MLFGHVVSPLEDSAFRPNPQKKHVNKWIERLPKPRYFVFYSVFPFAISFANVSRCRVFLSRHPCVWNTFSRAFAENMWQKFTVFRSEVRLESFDSKHNGHSFAAVIIVATSGSILHLVASSSFTSSSSTPPSTASARFQWALQDPKCDRGSEGAQPDTTSARSQWALPLPYQMGGGHPASQGFRGSFAELSRSFRGFSGHIYTNLWIMYPYGSRYIWGSCLQTYLKPRFWALKVSFANFRGSKSSQEFSRIFRKRSFSFRGAILL